MNPYVPYPRLVRHPRTGLIHGVGGPPRCATLARHHSDTTDWPEVAPDSPGRRCQNCVDSDNHPLSLWKATE